ncbi:helix-turn-helix domain-containing protein [Legionella pneumophila]|uniref:Winged helix-turn-helix domain-containing protein n=1 Tax=Legionella adelaidensis TaxID=45056 RepID=A0A0W0R2V6_9GAMM|nr:helix-turn-helix domain-containing protein [Legionella adelaidensis]KTC65354.1 hypothetical protein Lade_0012 [Legionella adelaidensis]VEH84824.1 Uncharacterised protein [Legionella adelaidensis]HAT2008746.1 hypothetical protein [Legionella pneumophila]
MTKKNSPVKLGNPPKNHHKYNNSKSNQQARMLKAFKEHPKRSTFAFHNMGIVSPASRIKDLRAEHNITTEWINEPDKNGIIHKIALYVYLGAISQGDN